MFDSIMQWIADYPYLGAALLFVLCGIGLPLPEELVLIASGYVCAKFPERTALSWMMLWCGGAILAGDLLPYLLGRLFGPRILRWRWLRLAVSRRRLASFDRWFRRRGDLVIFIARFLAGIRMIAFFTAGMMKMPWRRFLMLDGLGIALLVPLLIWLGYSGAGFIDNVIDRVQTVERGLLWSVCGVVILGAGWLWLWRHRRQQKAVPPPAETFVEPQLPVQDAEPPSAPATLAVPPAAAAEATGDVVELPELDEPAAQQEPQSPPPRAD